MLERLEERLTPSTYTVDRLGSTGAGSGQFAGDLRYCIAQANSDGSTDTIQFSPSLFSTPQTIDLTKGLGITANNLTIQGPGAGLVTISGTHQVQVFNVSAATVSVSGVTITGGYGSLGGGIEYTGAGTMTLAGVVLSGSTAGDGGGIANAGSGTVAMTDCTVTNNFANTGGGIVIKGPGSLTLTRCTVANNSAGTGAGIQVFNYSQATGPVALVDCTIAGNSSAGSNRGGGLSVSAPIIATLTNCTIFGNSAYAGGGISTAQQGSVKLNNTIVAGNSASFWGPDLAAAATTSSSYNLIGISQGLMGITNGKQGNKIGSVASPWNPKLNPLANNGGPTETMALQPGSPALNAGSNALAVDAGGNPLVTDQRGANRIYGGTTDIGAYQINDTTKATLTASANSTFYGQPVTFTATITPVTTLTADIGGTVQFLVDGADFGNPVAVSGGKAIVTTGAIPAGTHTLMAFYSGDFNYNDSSVSRSQTVKQASTTTGLAPSSSNPVFGQDVTLTATVAPVTTNTGLPPSGTVTFLNGTTVLGTATPDSSGKATFDTTALPVGKLSITASYGGDNNFKASKSAPLSLTVTKDTTTALLTSSASPNNFSSSVTFTATVSQAAPGQVVPSGTVYFRISGVTVASVTLANGQASYTTKTMTLGDHNVVAVYTGSPSFIQSTSTTVVEQIVKDPTTTTVSSSLIPAISGQTVTFTALVVGAGPGAGPPVGTITILDNGTVLETTTLVAGMATFTSSTLSVGKHNIVAVFAGNADFAFSKSVALPEVINPVPAGLVSWYKAEGDASDAEGNNNGTLQGATFAPGLSGQAFSFNGSNDVSVPYSSSLALNPFTVSVWVNLAKTPSGNAFGILGTRFGGEYTFDLKVEANKVHGDVGSGTHWISTAVDFNATITPGTWYNITYVINRSAAVFSLYLDGVLQNTIPFKGTPLFMSPTETLEIGNDAANEYFDGLIDEVQIYRVALSQVQVQALYKAPSAPVNFASVYNREGIVTDGSTFSGGTDGDGNAYSTNLLGPSLNFQGNAYTFGAANINDVVSAAGQTIALPLGNDILLSFLAVGVNGNQTNQTFTVTYTDGSTQQFTQSFSDWEVFQNFVGQSVASSMLYTDISNGGALYRTHFVYGYSFNLNPAKQAASITLPNDSNLILLAMDVTRA
jgi:hypothetical protein